jgi:hypothetical protein
MGDSFLYKTLGADTSYFYTDIIPFHALNMTLNSNDLSPYIPMAKARGFTAMLIIIQEVHPEIPDFSDFTLFIG